MPWDETKESYRDDYDEATEEDVAAMEAEVEKANEEARDLWANRHEM